MSLAVAAAAWIEIVIAVHPSPGDSQEDRVILLIMTRIIFPTSNPILMPPAQGLTRGVELSKMYGMSLTPIDVARVLSRAKVRYVLIGAHAINLYTGKPRATQDVDVVTDSPAKASKAIRFAFPNLTVEDHPAVVRFKDGNVEVLDLIKAKSGKLFRKVLQLITTSEIDGDPIIVPTAEAALALKFHSMTNPTRPIDDRMQDAVDFSRAAKSQRNVDQALLKELGELVYSGGGEALLKLLDDARKGRRLEI